MAASVAVGRSRAAGRLVVKADLCHGCQACMIACSLVKEGRAVPTLARIHVVLDSFTARQALHYCRQCRNAPCARACPNGAIALEARGGYWVVQADLCDGCGACVEACPFGAMSLHPSGIALKCDTCAGAPECVASCPSGALTWEVRP